MAIVSGKITHDRPEDFGGIPISALAANGYVKMAPRSDGTYGFSASYISTPINLLEVEATSVGSLSHARVVFPMEPPRTLGLWHPKEGKGLTMADDSASGAGAVLSSATSWASAGGAIANPPNTWGLTLRNAPIDFGSGAKYAPTAPLSLELGLITNSTGAGQQFTDPSNNVSFTFGNYSSTGGMKIEVTPYYAYYNYNNGTYGWAWSYHLVKATLKTAGGDLVATVNTAPLSPYGSSAGSFNGRASYGATFDGNVLTVSATDGTNLVMGSATLAAGDTVLAGPYANLTCQQVSTNASWNLNSSALFFGSRVTRGVVTPSEMRNNLANLLAGTKVLFQTRSAASSGGFVEDWIGNSGDLILQSGLDFDSFEPVAQMTFGPNVALYDATAIAAGASAFASAYQTAYPPTNAFDGDVNTQWRSATNSNDAATPNFLAYDFGPARSFHIRRMALQMLDTTNIMRKLAFQLSDDGKAWTTVHNARVTTTATTFVVDLPPSRAARFWRILNDPSVGSPNLAIVVEMKMFEAATSLALPVIPNLSFAMDTTAPFAGKGSSLKVTGTSTSNGQSFGIRLPMSYVPLADFLGVTMRCDNPQAKFRLRLHTDSAIAAPAKSASAAWFYDFTAPTSWSEVFFPDYGRTAILQATADPTFAGMCFWVTLEVIEPAGGFNLWIDKTRMGSGLKAGDTIQTPLGAWFQYRAILLTTN